MPAAIPLIAVVAGGAASAALGGGLLGALVGAGAAFVVSSIGASVFPAKRPAAPTRPGDDATAPGAGRTQSFRQPITEHQIVFGRCKVGGPIVFIHSAPDDESRADGWFYSVAFLAGYELEFLPASVAVWQGYGGALGATAASVPTTEPTAFRARAVARSGAVSGWREAAVPGAVTAPAALGITGGVRLSGGVPIGTVRLQVFEANSASLAAATKLATEPTALPWDRTGLTTGQTRWYWLRSVSADGNVSAFAGPVTITAL